MLNRRLTALCLGLGIGFAGIALAADAPTQNSLDDQLKSLDLPSNQAPAGVTEERLYSVQSRYFPLAMKSEVFVGFGKNFTPDGL